MQRFSPTKYLLLLLIIPIILRASPSGCCLEQERVALLQLKSHFMSFLPSGSSIEGDYLVEELGSWGDMRNCCTWNRVTCDETMQHVTDLSLYGLCVLLPTTFYALNVSLFQPFEELTSLNLSFNDFSGLVGLKGNNKESSLRKLEIFDFGYNSVIQHQQLEDFVGSLTSLKGLFLRYTGLEESFARKVLVNLKQLKVVDMGLNSMNMPMNELLSAVPKELQVLDLSMNSINGSLSEHGLCGLRNLQELHLRKNRISGNLPRCIGNMTSLRTLDISHNNLSGDLSSIIPNLKFLESLSISDNSFYGDFSLTSLFNYSNLGVLILSNNHVHIKIDYSLHHHSSIFQPETLGLSNCNLNLQRISFMKFLSQMRNLQVLDISHNGLVGSFPTWLLLNNSNLEAIILRNNSFGGALSLPKHENQSLLVLDISDNNFKGSFPENIGLVFPILQLLNTSTNNFKGKIPASVGNMTTLEFLDLSNNHFSGEVPRRMLTHCGFLQYLKLSNNNLQGEIIPGYMNLPSLIVFYLDGNHFTGTISDGVLASKIFLSEIDISNNEVTGGIPSWIGNLSSLIVLSLSYNHLKGQIPSEICILGDISYLDLSNNELTGIIPSCYNHSLLLGLQLHNNYLSGSIPNGLTGSLHLFTLDLSGKQLSGGIPLWFGNLSELKILILRNNFLGGELPHTLCKLDQINIMDLSSNNISGDIPACLANMSFGAIPILYNFEMPIGFVAIEILTTWLFPNGLPGDSNEEVVALLTKSRYYDYKGYILNIMSMLDLSCNRLTGEIPRGLGQLGKLQALNLSHNELSGSIPSSFSMLKRMESLDLSFNNFSGVIPYQLAQVTALEIFNVSYNNLSGTVPETGQFASFDERNYMGNPFLCGFVGKSCIPTSKNADQDREEDDSRDGFDWQLFFWSFGMSSIILFVGINVVLLINPEWRRAWFVFSDYHILWWL